MFSPLPPSGLEPIEGRLVEREVGERLDLRHAVLGMRTQKVVEPDLGPLGTERKLENANGGAASDP